MPQLSLFESSEAVLADDERGRIVYRPGFVPPSVLIEGLPIALVSLGATRRMAIRAKNPPRRVLHVDLAGGSLLTMSYATQLHYDHGVPKTAEA